MVLHMSYTSDRRLTHRNRLLDADHPSEIYFVIPAEEYRWLLAHHFRLSVTNRQLVCNQHTDGCHNINCTTKPPLHLGKPSRRFPNNNRDSLYGSASDRCANYASLWEIDVRIQRVSAVRTLLNPKVEASVLI